MRKLGLVLVLLFTLSIVSAADFTISGKITPKTGVTPLVDGAYPAAFTFSDTTTYSSSVTMSNGVFTADFSTMPNAASVVAASNSVTMVITALGQTQTFSDIPLTTVPKAVHAVQADHAYESDLAMYSQNLQSGKDLQLNQVGNNENAVLSLLVDAAQKARIELWQQGTIEWGIVNAADGFFRITSGTDDAYTRFQIEDTGEVTIPGDLVVDGAITGDGSGLTGLVGGNSISNVDDTATGAIVDGTLVAGATTLGVTSATSYDTTGKTTTGSLESGTTILGDTTILEAIFRITGLTNVHSKLTATADRGNAYLDISRGGNKDRAVITFNNNGGTDNLWNLGLIYNNGVVFSDFVISKQNYKKKGITGSSPAAYDVYTPELAIDYDTGNVEIANNLILSEKIYQDYGTTADNYDVWIQGSKGATGADRNLALLGGATSNKLYLNYAGEYEAGTEIGGASAPTKIMGAAHVVGTLKVTGTTTFDGRVDGLSWYDDSMQNCENAVSGGDPGYCECASGYFIVGIEYLDVAGNGDNDKITGIRCSLVS